jgi:hypothetical protein
MVFAGDQHPGALTVLVWAVTRIEDISPSQDDLLAGALLVTCVLVISLMRYTAPLCCLTPTRPPNVLQVLLALVVVGGISFWIVHRFQSSNRIVILVIFSIIGVFVVLKTEELTQFASSGLRLLTGQSTDLASHFDIRWLGFSYLAFRLLHTLP